MPQEQSHLPNWTGLLGWSTKYHDGTHASQFGPMSEERRHWLEKALNATFDGQEDPNKVIKKAVVEMSEGRISAGLDLLDYASDFPDCAENFDQLGALGPLVRLVGSSDINIVRRALEVLTMYLPNNPKVQLAAALRQDCLTFLKGAIARYSQDPVTVHFSLSAMGSLVRNVASLENSFIMTGGVEYLCTLGFNSTDNKIVQKIAAILSSLMQGNDLSERKGQIESFVVNTFKSPSFPKDNIQFWEVMSSLGMSLQGNSSIQSALKDRKQWIMTLPAGEEGDFKSELETLSSI